MGAMHMALLGPEGIEKLSLRNFASRQLTESLLSKVEGLNFPHSSVPHYNEFVVELPSSAAEALDYLDEKGLIGGFDLSNWYPDKKNWLLICSTDQNTRSEIELLVETLSEWTKVVL
jgi:glycine dehydrogenase subunit 1